MSSSRTSNHITHEYKELAFLHGITDLPATPPEASVPLPLPGSALVPSSLPGGCPDVEDSTWALGTLGAHLTRKVPRRRLVITKQPSSEFYKDEGGKANALSVEVSLLEYDENGAKIRTPDDQFVDIPLRVELRFESGKVVDPSEEIFRFVGSGYDANVIRASDRKALILFRLEKVSRRKDGQRFKLLIEADQEQCTANVSDLSGVFTNAICVLSKRKHHHHHHHHHQSHQADTMPREPPAKQARITDAQHWRRIEEKCDSTNSRQELLLKEMQEVRHQMQRMNEFYGTIIKAMAQASAVENTNWDMLMKMSCLPDDTNNVVAKSSLAVPMNELPYFVDADDGCETSSSDISLDAAALPFGEF